MASDNEMGWPSGRAPILICGFIIEHDEVTKKKAENNIRLILNILLFFIFLPFVSKKDIVMAYRLRTPDSENDKTFTINWLVFYTKILS